MQRDSADTPAAVRDLARARPGLTLLLLFGSRARGDAHARSDWDFGYLADERFDVPGFLAAVIETVRTDDVDLVDLARAGGLLRYRAARDGAVLFESRPRAGEQFRLDAAGFWCEAEPVLRRGYEAVLHELDA